jgi:signal transduction histidine kinase
MTGALAFALLGLVLAAWLHLELRRRGQLVARACHELRGPLTAAGLALHAAGREDEVERSRLGAVDLELRRAALALEDLQAARDGRRARDAAAAVDVGRLLLVQAETWRAVARACGRVLRLGGAPCGAVVRGDRVRLAQAIGNLLGNALEHGDGEVVLSARPAAGWVRIEVADGGPGLGAPLAELIARERRRSGPRGHGLAIAAGVARRHGGRLVAAPAAHGARIALELPAMWPAVAAASSTRAPGGRARA